MNPILFYSLIGGGKDALFDANHRTREKTLYGWNVADFIKVEDLEVIGTDFIGPTGPESNL